MRGVFVTDLDGTLLQADQTISDYSAEVLNSAIEAGCIVTYATARGLRSSRQATDKVNWKSPVILYNGALVYDAVDMRVVDGYWLDEQITNQIFATGRQYGLLPFHFLLDEGSQERVHHEKLCTFGMIEFFNSRVNDPRFREFEQLHAAGQHQTLILTYISELDKLLPLRAKVEAIFGNQISIHMMKDYYIRDQYFLEFSHPLATKREGLNIWARHMKIDPGEIHVFGDNLNDVGLLEAGGKKLAVSNAHEQILRLADQIIASNNEDGVARYIDAFRKASADGRR